jgi:hypothetical protein
LKVSTIAALNTWIDAPRAADTGGDRHFTSCRLRELGQENHSGRLMSYLRPIPECFAIGDDESMRIRRRSAKITNSLWKVTCQQVLNRFFSPLEVVASAFVACG